jgi:hypothetical protein
MAISRLEGRACRTWFINAGSLRVFSIDAPQSDDTAYIPRLWQGEVQRDPIAGIRKAP